MGNEGNEYKPDFANISDLEACIQIEKQDETFVCNEFQLATIRSAIENNFVFVQRKDNEIIAYVRLEFVTLNCVPMVVYWYVKPEYRGQYIGYDLMNNVNSYLKKHGFEYTLFSNYEAGMVSVFERRGMYHIGNLDVDTKVGYVCLRMYADYYGQPGINDVFKFVLSKLKFKFKYFFKSLLTKVN